MQNDLISVVTEAARQCLDPMIHNDIRRISQDKLDSIEAKAPPQQFADACNCILLDTSYGGDGPALRSDVRLSVDAACSYCGTALARAISAGRIPPHAVNYQAMHILLTRHMLCVAGIKNNGGVEGEDPKEIDAPLNAPLRKLHSVALSRVIIACAKLTFPDNFQNLFDPFFFIAVEGAQSHPKPLMISSNSSDAWQLVDFYLSKIMTVDELNPCPTHLLENERKSRMAVGRVTASLIQVLFSAIENTPGGVDNVNISIYQSLFNIVETLIPHASPAVLADRPAMLVTFGLRKTGADDEELACACGSLFAAMCGKKGIVTGEARGWMRQVIDALDGLLVAGRWNAVANVIEGFEELPIESLQSVAPEVADLAGKVLRTRSLFYAHRLLPILNRLIDSAQQAGVADFISILPEDLIPCIFELCPRNKGHPSFATSYQAAAMAAEQFLSDEQYETAFAEFRSAASRTLRQYAELSPQRAAAALGHILSTQLRPPNDTDTRNEMGYVTQRSAAFFTWDAALFCVEHLAHCYQSPTPYAAGPVQPVWDALVGTINDKLNDAVLVPSYLKMMAALWHAPDIPWPDALRLLLHYATLRNPRAKNLWEDKDLVAARRRALTLLVHACTHHGKALVPLMDELRSRMSALWMSNQLMSSESNHLLEAATSLSCFMTDEEQQKFLDSIAQEPIGRVVELGRNITPDILRQILFEDPQQRGKTQQQSTLIDDIGLVTGVLRRAAASNYARRAMGVLIGPVTQLTESLHTLHASAPPQVMAAFEVPEETQDVMQGAAQRVVAHAHSQHNVDPNLRRIRSFVQRTRECCYQLLPIAMRIFGSVTAEVARCLEGMRLDILPLHVASAAVKHLFTQALELYPPCAPLCLRILLPLFTSNRSNSNKTNQHQQQRGGGGGGGGCPNQNNNNNTHYQGGGSGPRGNNNQVYVSRQMFFIYKDFTTAVRNHVVSKGYHASSPEICQGLVDFFSAVVTQCPDVTLASCRDAANFVVEVQNDQMAAQLYVSLCRAIGTSAQALSQRDRESAGDAVFSVYHKNFDRFSRLLQNTLPPNCTELLQRFHNALRTIQRFPPRRNKFIEFCVQMFS